MQFNGLNVDSQIEEQKKKKITKLIIIFMVLIFIAIIGIVCLIMYIQQGAFRVYVNGSTVKLPEDTIIIEPSGKVYVSIKDIAKVLGYEAHNGEYKLYTEDTNKCYVDSKYETASFFLNSNRISKMPPDQTKDYADYVIDEPVLSRNGKLYCSEEGIRIGFNTTFNYNEETNKIQIYTLPKLVEMYTPTIVGYGYEGISENFENQKAILYNMFVVRKEKGLYGVVDKDNKEIISSKYAEMTFNENAREFYVTSTVKKVGIVTETGKTKINLLYDEIQFIDKENKLYLVKSNNKYGIIGDTGNTVIHLEYDQIGVDSTQFLNNDIKNKYLLFDNTIPVLQNSKWGMFNKKGDLIVPIEFDYMGYISGQSGNNNTKAVNNLLIIPSYKCIVVGKKLDSKTNQYGVYDYQGNEIIPLALQSAYSITNAGVNTYYMEHNGSVRNIEDYISKLYEIQGKTKPKEETDTTQDTNTTNS